MFPNSDDKFTVRVKYRKAHAIQLFKKDKLEEFLITYKIIADAVRTQKDSGGAVGQGGASRAQKGKYWIFPSTAQWALMSSDVKSDPSSRRKTSRDRKASCD